MALSTLDALSTEARLNARSNSLLYVHSSLVASSFSRKSKSAMLRLVILIRWYLVRLRLRLRLRLRDRARNRTRVRAKVG